MNEEKNEKMLNLLADRAVFGLNETELAEFEKLAQEFPELENDDSFEIAAAAFSLVNLDTKDSLPEHLKSKILIDADNFFAITENEPEEIQKTFAFKPKTSIWSWLGWAAAGLAVIALLINIWQTRQQPKDVGTNNPQPTISPSPKPVLDLSQQREQLLASADDTIQRKWADIDPKQPRNIEGDVVWSNSRQKGFIRFHNLPANDKTKETYQLWIFDAKQDAKTPVDGGVFDVDQNGDVIIPIDAKLEIQKPTMFAVTAEKPGGVVVSKLGKVMTIAKIET